MLNIAFYRVITHVCVATVKVTHDRTKWIYERIKESDNSREQLKQLPVCYVLGYLVIHCGIASVQSNSLIKISKLYL